MTYLELRILLDKLPIDSAYQAEVRDAIPDDVLARAMEDGADGPHGRWSRDQMLLASLFDAISMLIHVQISRAGVKSKPPEPLRRPGVVGKSRSKPNPQAVAYLQKLRDTYEREGQ